MTEPVRIQLSRKKGWRMPPNTVKVSRPSIWGNPFNDTQIATMFCVDSVDGVTGFPLVYFRCQPSLDRCIDLYIAWLRSKMEEYPDLLSPLRGKNLACWCHIGAPCHADVLLDLANRK